MLYCYIKIPRNAFLQISAIIFTAVDAESAIATAHWLPVPCDPVAGCWEVAGVLGSIVDKVIPTTARSRMAS